MPIDKPIKHCIRCGTEINFMRAIDPRVKYCTRVCRVDALRERHEAAEMRRRRMPIFKVIFVGRE
jgi:hypothetical protein